MGVIKGFGLAGCIIGILLMMSGIGSIIGMPLLFVSSAMLFGFRALPIMGIAFGIFISLTGVGAVIGFPIILASSVLFCACS